MAEDQRYALLEYVSHLTAKDYEATLTDLIVLGFIPKEIGEDPEKVGCVLSLISSDSFVSFSFGCLFARLFRLFVCLCFLFDV